MRDGGRSYQQRDGHAVSRHIKIFSPTFAIERQSFSSFSQQEMSTSNQRSTQTILGKKRGRRKIISSVVKSVVSLPGPSPIIPSSQRQAQETHPPPSQPIPSQSLPAVISNRLCHRQSSPDAPLNFPSSDVDFPDDFDLERPSSPDPVVLHSLKQVKRIRVSPLPEVHIYFGD